MKQAFLFLCYGYFVGLFAQNGDTKRDYIWRSGYGFSPAPVTIWNFQYKPTYIDSFVKQQLNQRAFSIISNTDGNVLLFSNGCMVSNSTENIITNINTGSVRSQYCPPNGYGYTAASMLILPVPADSNSFIVFHTHLVERFYIEADALMTTKLTKNQGTFTARYVDSVLIRDTLERVHLAACRHANGQDWWLLHPKAGTNLYHKVFFSNQGFQKSQQSIGYPSDIRENSIGQAVFSPDGTKYVRYNVHSDIRIFDFDRCTGQLSNPLRIPIRDASDRTGSVGCAISASSRFLYIISSEYIYQFDLQAIDVAASKTIVLTYDPSLDLPQEASHDFTEGQLGPDGKIYVSSAGGRRVLHLIEAPDSAGLACRAVQRRFVLKSPIMDAIPRFPNFRLGSLRGSACDTLTAMQELSHSGGYEMKLYPNPATEMLTIDVAMPDFDIQNLSIDVSDVFGHSVYRAPLPPFTPIHQVDVSSFGNGVYVVSLKINGKTKKNQKVMILH
jgi:hypothetical protein